LSSSVLRGNGSRRAPDFDVICLSHLRWDFVWQRPQHLLSRCAQKRRVYFVEERIDAEEPRLELRRTDSGVVVVEPHFPPELSFAEADETTRRLLDELIERERIDDYVLWFNTPMAVAATRHLQPVATVYDNMDELAGFRGAPLELVDREAELLERADLVFTGGQSLYEAKRDRHPSVHLFPSSVETDHWATAREPQCDPRDQAGITRPRLGYYGVIDERMDLDLLAAVADKRPEWQLVLIGPVVKIEDHDLPRADNIHYLGPKAYEELPRYVAGWDVAILPFARNEATRFVSPTKTPEYLAAGRPVVSTSIRDVVRPYGDARLVRIADDPADFAAAVEAALREDGRERRRRVDSFLTENSWDYTWADMSELVTRAAERRLAVKRFERTPTRRIDRFDWLVVGAGFAGATLAERLARDSGQRVLVCDRRNHIAGNAYDHYDEAGILVHRYGPHIFHTNSGEVFEYLTRFTAWRPYEHRVLASVDGQLVPFPINLDTVNQLYGLNLNALELEDFFDSQAEPRSPVRTSEDVVVSKVGRDLYLKFFRNYTRKQWDLDPSELDASVTARVPTRLNRDDRYFTDTFQAMPLHGYTRMFERMLDHPDIKVLLNTDYRELQHLVPFDRMVYTGPVDEYFDFRYGKLPYRSLEFRFETHDAPLFQQAPVINFPNEHAYTRVTEFKYLTGQEHGRTTVVYEYPQAEGDPYYPVPRPENAELYKAYKELADAETDTVFVGRLATYKYYNMDQVVAQALATYRKLRKGDDLATDLDPAARALGRRGMHGQPSRGRLLRSG
jgi:UDP-galactopyranose mutase